ncbi:hypothetical protein [Halobacterium zhouii]|uniref:hypothetical protein n=1 Tax=Halobacterium zhouii TaxID=2902624 RepID=UPI001E46473B|nr:hypothetical protein [Halobacterium zhouii]
MATISITDVRADGNTLECDVDVPPSLNRFFGDGPFVVEYDQDVSSVPEGVLAIPVLGHVCPVAWAVGADVSVGVVDREYVESLPTVRDALVEMHPAFVTDATEIRAREVVEESPDRDGEETAQLFTGGVDSLATYVRHHEEDPTLLSVHGWSVDADDDDHWRETMRYLSQFASDRGLEHRTVRSNMLSFLNVTMLDAHFRPHYDGSWYSDVGHGIGLLSLCAPLAYERGIGELHIASTHTKGYDVAWGSHPTIDERVSWTGTTAVHDGFELTRQEKVGLLASHAERADTQDFDIRTCIYDDAGGNCSGCEKCYRTMVALDLEGVDPNEFGYDYSKEVLADIQSRFESAEWHLRGDKPYFWGEIQERVPEDVSEEPREVREFYRWLRNADFEQYTAQAGPKLKHRVLRAVARHTPYRLYRPLYPVYEGMQRRLPIGGK